MAKTPKKTTAKPKAKEKKPAAEIENPNWNKEGSHWDSVVEKVDAYIADKKNPGFEVNKAKAFKTRLENGERTEHLYLGISRLN